MNLQPNIFQYKKIKINKKMFRILKANDEILNGHI